MMLAGHFFSPDSDSYSLEFLLLNDWVPVVRLS